MSAESFRTISMWIEHTFGKNAEDRLMSYEQVKAQLNRLIEETEEFKEELKNPERSQEKLGMEAADIYITLAGVCTRAGLDLPEYVDRKMQINRHRKWNVRPDGSAQHVKESLYLS